MCKSKNIVWVLGGCDPEMEHIEKHLVEEEENVYYAMNYRYGKLVRGQASSYKAEVSVPSRNGWTIDGMKHICLVECSIPLRKNMVLEVDIDHHRKIHWGYHLPPKDYWKASAIGQMWDYLHGDNETPPEEYLYIAAADHCLWFAYKGQCPGVIPNKLFRMRMQSKAKFQRCDVSCILQKVEKARGILESAPVIVLGDAAVADIRREGNIPELPEASSRYGISVLYQMPYKHRMKEGVLSSNPKVIRAAMHMWKNKKTWGSPERGFAGAWVR